jgi:hypothetical protein
LIEPGEGLDNGAVFTKVCMIAALIAQVSVKLTGKTTVKLTREMK